MADKSQMDTFYKECLRFGCLEGFKHFSLYLRGREELVVTVHHEGVSETPVDSRNITFGKTTQHVPPASPAVVGSSHQDNPEHTLFLVGAYARYNWPYVWVRSNLGKFGQGTADKDLPLDLRTTTHWKDKGYKVWDIIEELVTMNIIPTPHNPFEVNLDALSALSPMERTLRSGALANFLKDLLMRESSGSYAGAVQADLLRVLELHFATTDAVVQ